MNVAPAPLPAALPQLGIGRVSHCRLRPLRHAFVHASYFLFLPLRALRDTPAPALARNRFGLIAFHDADHGDGRADCLAWLEELLAREAIHDANGEVWLQCLPRVLGYAFKPVSFWFCHGADGDLRAVVVEVNNTFGERHCYLLAGAELAYAATLEARKVFHVSPFCAVRGGYRFRFLRDAGRCVAAIEHHDDHGPLLTTRWSGELDTLTPARMRRAFFGVPLMTLGVIVHIHWHALRLSLKRVPFFRKPCAPETFVTR